MRNKTYSEEERLRLFMAVVTLMLYGLTPNWACSMLDVPRSTFDRWRKVYSEKLPWIFRNPSKTHAPSPSLQRNSHENRYEIARKLGYIK